MDTWEIVAIGGFGSLVVGTLCYTVLRLAREPRGPLNENAAKFARVLGFPKVFDPLIAKPLSHREVAGAVIVAVLMVAGVVLTLWGK